MPGMLDNDIDFLRRGLPGFSRLTFCVFGLVLAGLPFGLLLRLESDCRERLAEESGSNRPVDRFACVGDAREYRVAKK